MSTYDKVIQKKQLISKLERNLQLEKLKKRKAETRKKIELGGLVIKSGMHAYSKDIILGALAHALQSIEDDVSHLKLFESLGESIFLEQGKKYG